MEAETIGLIIESLFLDWHSDMACWLDLTLVGLGNGRALKGMIEIAAYSKLVH
jgi:hypothetical protein